MSKTTFNTFSIPQTPSKNSSNNKNQLHSRAKSKFDASFEAIRTNTEIVENEKRRKLDDGPNSVPQTPAKINNRPKPFPSASFSAPLYGSSKPAPIITTNTPKNPYQLLCEQAKGGSITIKGKEVELMPFSDQGNFFDVYLLPDGRVLKVLNARCSKKSPETIKAYLTNQRQNCLDGQELNLNVVPIDNIETMLDDMFVIQKKIEGTISLKNDGHLKMVNHFFVTSLTAKKIFDLHPKNLGIDQVKETQMDTELHMEVEISVDKVALFDFVENPKDGQHIFIEHALEMWCRKGMVELAWGKEEIRDLLVKLTQNFPSGYDIEAKLKTLFTEVKPLVEIEQEQFSSY